MLTCREKVEILKNFQADPTDTKLANIIINCSQSKILSRTILQAIISKLTELDVYISVMYNVVSEETWEAVTSEYDTPLESGYSQLKVDIRTFLDLYNYVEDNISKFSFGDILDVFKSSLTTEVKNMQFILFKLCKDHPQEVMKDLFNAMVKDPISFIPVVVSLLVRCNFDEKIKIRCCNAYFAYLNTLKPSESLHFILACQSFLYILCFKKEMFKKYKSFVDLLFSKGIPKYMNKQVVDVFCDIFGYTWNNYLSFKNDCLNAFVFDLPVLRAIEVKITDFYVVFEP